MGENSSIEWTSHTFNPWWGCVKVSPACDHCYAETFSKRVGYSETGSQFPIWGKDSSRRFFGDKHWAEPLKWNAKAELAGIRQRVFCASMADVMEEHEDLHDHRQRLLRLIEATPALDWLLLTKRPQNYRRFLPAAWIQKPRPNVWLGTTVESAEYVWRAVELAKTPARTRFISYEPALGPVDFSGLNLDWIIAGGESGPGARPAHPDWFRSVRDQCRARKAAFFFKQWGGAHNKSAGRFLDGKEYSQFPELAHGSV